MLLRKLFWGALGLAPLVASIDVEKCLSSEFINSLPEEMMQETARDIKRHLNLHGSLHLDKPQTWGPNELVLFSNVYFPKLKKLVMMAIRKADFHRSMQSPGSMLQWPRSLRDALKCLMDFPSEDCFQQTTVAPVVSPVSKVALLVAKSNFTNLYQIFKQLSEAGINPAQFKDPQWEAEADALKYKAKVDLMLKFVEMLVDEDTKPRLQKTLLQQLDLHKEENFHEMEQIFNGFIKEIETLFSHLRLVKGRLLSLNAPSSWIALMSDSLWESVLHTATPDYSRLSRVLNHFRARFLVEVIILQLEGSNIGLDSSGSGSPSGQSYGQLLQHAEATRRMVEALSAQVQLLIEDQTSVDLSTFMGVMMELRLRPPADCREIRLGLWDMRESLKALRAKATDGPAPDVEEIESLIAAHQIAKSLVESYATILDQALKMSGEGEVRDLFLLSLFHSYIEDECLILAKDVMDHVEEILEGQLVPGIERYIWENFPLSRWPPRSQMMKGVTNEGTVNGEEESQKIEKSVLKKRDRSGGEGPNKKRSKHGSDEED